MPCLWERPASSLWALVLSVLQKWCGAAVTRLAGAWGWAHLQVLFFFAAIIKKYIFKILVMGAN